MTGFVAAVIVGVVGHGAVGRRLASRCVDLGVATFIGSAILVIGVVVLGGETGEGTFHIGTTAAIITFLVALVVEVAVVALLDLGRRMLGLRLVHVDGRAAAFPRRLGREALAITPLFGLAAMAGGGIHPVLTAVVGLGYLGRLWYTIAKGEARRVDRLMGTRVTERTA